jgi:hypothetical protein
VSGKRRHIIHIEVFFPRYIPHLRHSTTTNDRLTPFKTMPSTFKNTKGHEKKEKKEEKTAEQRVRDIERRTLKSMTGDPAEQKRWLEHGNNSEGERCKNFSLKRDPGRINSLVLMYLQLPPKPQAHSHPLTLREKASTDLKN